MPVWAITRDGVTVASRNLSGAQGTKLVQWYISRNKASIVQTPAVPAIAEIMNIEGVITQPYVPAVPAVMRDPTTAEAIAVIGNSILENFFQQVSGWYKAQAAKTASDAEAGL